MNDRKVAEAVSIVLSFPILSIIEIVVINYIQAFKTVDLIIAVMLHVVTPFFPPLVYSKVLKKGDIFVSKREDRLPLFIPGILAYFIAALYFSGGGYRLMALLEVANLISSLLLFVISFKWKISIHMSSLAIPLFFFTLYGIRQALYFLPLLLLLGWARIKVKAHTLGQVIAGTIIGASSTFIVFLAI